MRRRDLVERAVSGDLEAFGELMRPKVDELFGIAKLVLRDADRARDATQEALVAAWRDLSALRDPDSFDPWLRRLLVNACYREARRGQRRARFEVRAAPVESIARAEPDPAVAVAEHDQLQRAFRHLDPGQRAMLVMYYYLDLPLKETADSLGLPLGTLKSRLHRTTQQLRATLEADARGSSPTERSGWRAT